jgi:hypothetical protein
MRANSRILVYGLLALMAMSCTQPRKAAQRACAKAERHMAKAIYKCPDLLKQHVQHDTVTVYLPGTTDQGETGYTQADMDSMMHLCGELMARVQERARIANQKVATLESEKEYRRETLRQAQGDITKRMRMALCDLEAVTVTDSLLHLKIWTEGGKLKYWYNVLPRTAQAAVTTVTTQVATKECPPAGVASGWRTYAITITSLLLLALVIVGLMVFQGLRANDPSKQG